MGRLMGRIILFSLAQNDIFRAGVVETRAPRVRSRGVAPQRGGLGEQQRARGPGTLAPPFPNPLASLPHPSPAVSTGLQWSAGWRSRGIRRGQEARSSGGEQGSRKTEVSSGHPNPSSLGMEMRA